MELVHWPECTNAPCTCGERGALMMRTNISAIRHTKELQREYNRMQSQAMDSPRRRLTRFERVLCWIALSWPEPFAGIAGRYYVRHKNRALAGQEKSA